MASMLPTLPNTASCVLDDSCTGFDCCVEINVIQRSVKANVYIDACAFKISFGIETFQSQILMDKIEYGNWNTFQIQGVVKLR